MATKIITKNSSTATSIPTAGDLVQGELAVNVTDKRLFTEDSGGAIVELGTNPSTLTSGAATFSGDIDVDGTTNLDVVDIDGAVDMASTLAVSGVASFADGSSSAPSITNTGDSNTGIYFPADEKIGFTAGGVPTFALDNQGNLLYTSSFQIQSDAQDGQIAIAGGNNSNDGANLGFYGPSHASLANIGKFRADTVETFRFGPTGSVFNEGSADLDFRVESDSNAHMLFVDGGANKVGIGRDPQDNGSTLQVAADATASTDLQLALRGLSNENKKLLLGFDTTSNIASITSLEAGVTHRPLHLQGSEFVWNESGSDHDFRVESDANTHAFFVNAGSDLIHIGKSNSSATVAGVTFAGAAQTNTISDGNTYHLHDTVNYKFYVNANGGIYNYQSNNVNLSDEREKKNIEELGSQWDVLKQWSLKKFHYNADDELENKKYGVIAQDVQAHNPELVTDFMSTEAETRLAVKEQQMMWMAIKALQEAQTRIETLESRITALES